MQEPFLGTLTPQGLNAPTDWEDRLNYLYATATWIGEWLTGLLGVLLGTAVPEHLAQPIGFLVLLTFFVILTEIAKKVAWFLVMIGWVLLLVRLAALVFHIG